MSLNLTGQKVSLTYDRLIQYIDGSFYNGLGMPVNIIDNSTLSYILVKYIPEASLNDTQFFWNNGILDVSVIGGSGVSQGYVDNADNLIKAQYIPNSSLGSESFYYDASNYIQTSGTAGIGLVGKWKYENIQTEGDPGSGYFRLNNASPSAASNVYLSNITLNGVDIKNIILQLKTGDYFYIQKLPDSTEYATYILTADAIDVTTYVKLVVSPVNYSGSFTNKKEFGFLFLFTARTQYATFDYVDGSLTNIQAKYIPDVSLSNDFVWNAGYLEVSLGGISDIATLSYVDGSLNNIRSVYVPDVSLNPGQFFWNNGILDVSVIGSGGISQSYVDGSLAARDASIQLLLSNQIIDEATILRIQATYIPDVSLDHSKFVWNNGVLDVSVIGGSGVSQAYVDGSLALRDASIQLLLTNQVIDEAAISSITSRHNFTETSLGILTSRHNFTETSLGILTSKYNFTETSLGILTSRHNFTETSLGILTSAFESSIGALNTNKVDGTGVLNQVAYWNGSKTITGDAAFIYDAVGNHLVVGTTASDSSATLLVDAGVTNHNTVGRFRGNLDGFLQNEVKNYSAGPTASADVVATANTGTDESDYIDMGINNANYIAGDSKALDGYLLLKSDASVADGANLLIGNATAGKDVILFTGDSIDAYTNEKIRITGDGSILIGQPVSKKHLLEVNGDINIPSGSHYLRNGQALDDTYTTYAYVDGSLSVRDSSITYLFNDKISKSQLDASLAKYLPYTGATQDLSLGTHSIKSVESIIFNQTPTVERKEGQLFYDATNKTLSLHTAGDVTLQLSQEQVILVNNPTGSTIRNGKVVYMIDTSNGIPTVDLARANIDITAGAIGVATQDILPNNNGFITSAGLIHDMSTGDYTPGTILYLSPTSAGELTSTAPSSPNIWCRVCKVIESSHTTGSVFVDVQQGRSITTLYDVGIVNPAVNQILSWSGNKWINSPGTVVSAGSGVTYFLSSIDSDVSNYESAWIYPNDASEKIEFQVVNSSIYSVIDNYLSEPSSGLGRTTLDGGVWEFNTFCSVCDSLSATSEIRTHVYKRSYLGVETSLFTVTTGDINSEIPFLYSTTSIQPEFNIDPSDRLLFRYVAYTDSSIDVSINFYHGGTTYYTHVHTPLSTRHNDLAGIQGGLAEDRWHLSYADVSRLSQTSGLNTGDQNLSAYAISAYVNSSINDVYTFNEATYLKEASLGSSFLWNNGLVDVSVTGGTGDVTKAYVDGSLSFRDTSIYNLTIHVDGSLSLKADILYVDTYNSIQDTSISGKTTKLYVDGSLNKRDLSINYLYEQLSATVSISYIDSSLTVRDACMGNIRATYIPDISLGDAFVWANGILNTATDPTADYNTYQPFPGDISIAYANNLAAKIVSQTSIGVKNVSILYDSNKDVSIVYISNYGISNKKVSFTRDVYRNITKINIINI